MVTVKSPVAEITSRLQSFRGSDNSEVATVNTHPAATRQTQSEDFA
jgi:hypothetical protein